jgi:hypothetical protein
MYFCIPARRFPKKGPEGEKSAAARIFNAVNIFAVLVSDAAAESNVDALSAYSWSEWRGPVGTIQ